MPSCAARSAGAPAHAGVSPVQSKGLEYCHQEQTLELSRELFTWGLVPTART